MKKFILALGFSILTTLFLTGCFLYNRSIDRREPMGTVKSNTSLEVSEPKNEKSEPEKSETNDVRTEIKAEPSASSELFRYQDEDSVVKTWQEAYVVFLRDFSVFTDNEPSFSLRDIDNNGIPELIIVHEDGKTTDSVLTTYYYDGTVYKIGDYSDSKIGVAGLRISDNPMFPGLFTSWWGGGVEHYGYLTVRNERLSYEYLWYIDRTTEPPRQKEISNKKELINESINAHSSNYYTHNLLEMYPINDENINLLLKTQNPQYLYPFMSENSLMGYIDATGKVAINPTYVYTGKFYGGFAAVSKDGEDWFYINELGEKVFNKTFKSASDFSENRAVVFSSDGKMQVMDNKGNMVSNIANANAYKYSDGMLKVKFENNLYGFIDLNGNIAIGPVYKHAQDFSEGLAAVEIDDKVSYIDKKGNIVLKTGFDYDILNENNYFSNGLACLSDSDGKYGFINKQGDVAIPFNFIYASPFAEGYAGILGSNDKWGFIDTTGNIVMEPKYDGVGGFSEGVAAVYLESGVDYKIGFINKKGELIIDCEYSLGYAANTYYEIDNYMYNSLIEVVSENENYWRGYIDVNNNIVFKVVSGGDDKNYPPDNKTDIYDIRNISILTDEDFDINYKGIIINSHRPFHEIARDLGIELNIEDSYKENHYNELRMSVNGMYYWFIAHYPDKENEEMTIEYVVDRTLQETWLVSVNLHTTETYRGIKVGDSLDDLIKAYGYNVQIWENDSRQVWDENAQKYTNVVKQKWYQYRPDFGTDEAYTDVGIDIVVDINTNTVSGISINYASNETFEKLEVMGH